LISEARQRNLRIVFVLMPLPPKHVAAFYLTAAWKAYQGHIQELLKNKNVSLLDASEWFPDAQKFGDSLHLNEEGAKEFSRRLGQLCGNLRERNSCGQ
jgi:lysophospholipase L1-like esterase